jgi:hypothetical protein
MAHRGAIQPCASVFGFSNMHQPASNGRAGNASKQQEVQAGNQHPQHQHRRQRKFQQTTHGSCRGSCRQNHEHEAHGGQQNRIDHGCACPAREHAPVR